MTEDDTFNALKKWPFNQLYSEFNKLVGANYQISIEEQYVVALELFKDAGWTEDEFLSQHRIENGVVKYE